MSGLCVVGGGDAVPRAEAIMARMSAGNLWTPHPGLALGGGDRHVAPDGVAVSLRGEMFDDAGLAANPSVIVADEVPRAMIESGHAYFMDIADLAQRRYDTKARDHPGVTELFVGNGWFLAGEAA